MMRRSGFTLIELLIVVAIIGILAAIAVPNFLNAQTKAKLSQVTSNMKALSTAMLSYQADCGTMPLHDPNHNYNIFNNALTTPVAYIATMPKDVFQSYQLSRTTEMFNSANGKAAELHPEPFYAPAYGCPSLDTNVPAMGSGGDLTLRFQDAPDLFAKARSQYRIGRYIVSVGPDTEHTYPGTYDISNGLNSRGDIIWVCP